MTANLHDKLTRIAEHLKAERETQRPDPYYIKAALERLTQLETAILRFAPYQLGEGYTRFMTKPHYVGDLMRSGAYAHLCEVRPWEPIMLYRIDWRDIYMGQWAPRYEGFVAHGRWQYDRTEREEWKAGKLGSIEMMRWAPVLDGYTVTIPADWLLPADSRVAPCPFCPDDAGRVAVYWQESKQ